MRLIDHNTGASVHRVHSEEEARLALDAILDKRLRSTAESMYRETYYNGELGPRSRTVEHASKETAVLGGALYPQGRDLLDRRTWLGRDLFFDPFGAHNVPAWPQSPAALRADGALAERSVADLAAHLNARLRADVAKVFSECADYDRPLRPWGREFVAVRDLFRCDGDLGEATVKEIADAIRSGGDCWTALRDWTPGGGVDGDPFAVCRYAWGPLRYSVRLDSVELLRLHLAGDADLTLYRTIVDIGAGRTEIIWPHQNFACCGRDWRLTGTDRWAVWADDWGDPDAAELRQRGRQCMLCGARSYSSWLTCRPAGEGDEPLAVIEEIDTLPAATLAAAAASGLHAITSNRPREDI